MIYTAFYGGWYADALPDGRYVVLRLDGSMTTEVGDVPPPPAGRAALFPRLNAVAARTQFAGQAWESYATLICTDGAWTDGPNPCGVSPVIYDNHGVLHISDCSIGSQGWRYCTPDNVLVTGDATYGPSADAPRLYEWTDLGPFVIGQGDQGGVWLWDKAAQVHRVLVDGPASCRFIRAHLDGDRVSVAFWGETGVPTACYWAPVTEFLALPILASTPTPIPPTPVPPTPEPNPMTFPAAAWALIEQMHARFNFTLPANEDGARTFTRLCCEQLAYSFPSDGWCWKSSAPGNPPSKDVTARQSQGRFEGWDILDAAGVTGPRNLAAPPGYHNLAGQHPIPVTATNHLGVTPQPPTPVPPTPQPPAPVPPPAPPVPGQPTNADIYAAIARVEAKLNGIFR